MSMAGEQITRVVFQNFPVWMKVVFYVVATGAMAVFFYGAYLKVQKYRRGRKENRFDRLGERLSNALRSVAASHTIKKRDPYAGVAHGWIFLGFLVLLAGTTTVFIDEDIVRKVTPWKILTGRFYLGFSLVLDVFGLLFVAGLAMMIWRRASFRLPQLDYRRPDKPSDQVDRSGYIKDDWAFLGLLLVIGVTGFLLEGMRIAIDRPPFEVWSPVGWGTAYLLEGLGFRGAAASDAHRYVWWFHALVVMVFIAYIPFSKAVHMLVDLFSLAFHDDLAARRLPRQPAEAAAIGYTKLADFSWKELLDFDACTKCGRCHISCPAQVSGAPLSPRDLILDLREHANATFGFRPVADGNAEIAGHVIAADTLWACTTCRACVEACPVGIEHVPMIVQMRRRLVDQGTMDENVQDALLKISRQGNSFGSSERMRGRWANGLEVKVKDARKEPVKYLWFVGDYASFDPRLQDISRAVARIFQRAGLDFGILYEGERNAGNDVRRAGEEGLFEMLVEKNVATLSQCQFQAIVTTDPHSYNTLRNEYPEFGAQYRVFHYTELLAELLEGGQLAPARKLEGRATFHDPCYLARYNGIIEPPREIIRRLGLELVEMPRHGKNSFCCGAGGGRIWSGDKLYPRRPAEDRIAEAMALGDIRYFVVTCPKDVVMYTDAVKTSGNEGKIEVRDIIQLFEEAL